MIKSSTTSVTTSAGTTSLTYDYECRITQITYPSSATNTFTYNGLDTRVGKVDSAGTATYKRDGDYVTAPVLDDRFAKFTPGVSERRGSTSRFNHPDRMGSVLRQTGVAQGSSASRQYDAFGNVFGSSGTFVGPFGFAGNWGYQSDADSGLQLLGHRYYDPSTGRFLTRDPIKDGRNWYGYCENNPLRAVDPEGLRLTFLYKLVDSVENIWKWGITYHPKRRYTKKWLNEEGLQLEPVAQYESRRDALDAERDLVETQPGPLNKEPWAGVREAIMSFIPILGPGKDISDGMIAIVDPYAKTKQDARSATVSWWLDE